MLNGTSFFRWFYSECSVEDPDFAQRKHININRTKVKKCSLHMYFELRDYCSSNIKEKCYPKNHYLSVLFIHAL